MPATIIKFRDVPVYHRFSFVYDGQPLKPVWIKTKRAKPDPLHVVPMAVAGTGIPWDLTEVSDNAKVIMRP